MTSRPVSQLTREPGSHENGITNSVEGADLRLGRCLAADRHRPLVKVVGEASKLADPQEC
jgi:hypothetical protein